METMLLQTRAEQQEEYQKGNKRTCGLIELRMSLKLRNNNGNSICNINRIKNTSNMKSRELWYKI